MTSGIGTAKALKTKGEQLRDDAPGLETTNTSKYGNSNNNNAQRLIGQEIGSYKLIGWLGKGAAAEVYRAIEVPLDRQVAFKIMANNDSQADPNFASRFLLEARAIAGLHHPNIITIYQYGEWRQRPYLVTELLEGGSLKEVLDGDKQLDLAQTVAIIAQVGAALETAHSHNIIHRDVKPSNVLLDGQGRAVLADFGIAKVLNAKDNLTMTGMSIGTPEYMSPEQAMGQPVDRRSDIYSLAILAYRMLAGRCPFQNESALAVLIAHSRETPPPLRRYNPAVPPAVELVVLRALAKKPDERYQTAAQFVNALQAAAGSGLQVNPSPMPPLQPIPNNAVDPGAAVVVNRSAPPPTNLTAEDDSLASPLYDEPTAFNPVVPRRQSYVQPAPPADYGQPYQQPTTYLETQPQDYGYDEQYIPVEPQAAAPQYYQDYQEVLPAPPGRRRRRRGLGILAFIIGILLAAGVFVGVWYYFLQGKTTTTVAGNAPGASTTAGATATANTNLNTLVNSRLIFGSTRNGKWGIYSATSKGAELKSVVNNQTDDISPALSPDGKSLLYVAAPGTTQWQIHKVSLDGSNDVTLTQGNFKDVYPAWSPDGTHIAFIREASDAENGALYIMDSDGKNQRKLNNDVAGYVNWNAGKLLIYSYQNPKTGSHSLRTLNTDNGQTQDLDALGAGEFDLPAWSPDGKRIAFAKGTNDGRAVYTANADGSNVSRISPDGTTATNPVFSPDGTRLAYLQKVGTVGNAAKWEVVEGGANGEGQTKLFNDGQQKFYLSWASPR